VRSADAVARWLRQLRYVARYRVSLHPSIYMPFARRHYAGTGIEVVGPDTELVIEGFGRSGSTFAVDAFESVQERPIRIAHHTHAAAQVVVGARMGLPTLLIVRHPVAATLSHMARRAIPAKPALKSWILFHERVLPWRERIVVASFESVTTDFGAVTRRLNERFGTEYREFDHTEANAARVFEIIEERNRQRFPDRQGESARSLARPTPEREALKESFRKELDSSKLRHLRERARRAYVALVPEAIPD
jgi:hypothetical protein